VNERILARYQFPSSSHFAQQTFPAVGFEINSLAFDRYKVSKLYKLQRLRFSIKLLNRGLYTVWTYRQKKMVGLNTCSIDGWSVYTRENAQSANTSCWQTCHKMWDFYVSRRTRTSVYCSLASITGAMLFAIVISPYTPLKHRNTRKIWNPG
jgi:hypothetical protein